MIDRSRSTSLAAAAVLAVTLAACGGGDDGGADVEVDVASPDDGDLTDAEEPESEPEPVDEMDGEEPASDGSESDEADDGPAADDGEADEDASAEGSTSSAFEFDEDDLIEIPDSPLETVDVAEIPGEDLGELVVAADAAGVSIPMVADAVAVDVLTTAVSESATFAVDGADPLEVLNAIGRDFDAQGWHATREMTASTTNDETTYNWEFSTQPYGADHRADLVVFEEDGVVGVRLAFFVPNDA